MLRRNACLFKPFESGAWRTPAQAPFCLHSGTVGFHILQSTMAKTANYRVDIPRVLQRFSINFKPPDPGFGWFFYFFYCCVYATVHTCDLSQPRSCSFKQKCRRVHCNGGVLPFFFFFYICVSLVCSCVQIQRDALSTKGVKINALFTFILTVTQRASEEFPVTFF